MLDIRLSYFYNLPPALLLSVYAMSKFDKVLMMHVAAGEHQLVFRVFMITLPAMAAAGHFFHQFYLRNDVYVREAVFILSVVQFLTYFIPAFLP